MDNDMKRLLQQHGLQVTAQRMATMRAVADRPHATADEVTSVVRAAIGAVSRQAVYDTLAVLVEKKLVRRIQTPGSPARFEDRVGDNHHHLICRECGATSDIDCAAGAAPCLAPSEAHGFEVDEAEVIYWGRCPACRAAAAAPAVGAVHEDASETARPRRRPRVGHRT